MDLDEGIDTESVERINVTDIWEVVFIGFKDQQDEKEGRVTDGNNPQISVV